MPQHQGLHLEQSALQVQRQSPQQILLSNLLELPIAGLEDRVKKELYENDALEEGHGEMSDNGTDDELTEKTESPVEEMYDEDDLPVYSPTSADRGNDSGTLGDSKSLIDDLMAQMAEYNLSDHEKSLVAYLIGSLNDNGFIDREIPTLVDELAFRLGIDTDEEELERMLRILQNFDPAGIGARNLKECLLIQIDRQIRQKTIDEIAEINLLKLEQRIVEKYHGSLVHNNIGKLSEKLNVSMGRIKSAIRGIRKLNPRPGRALSESDDDRSQTIIPDFIVETDSEGNVNLSLNNGYVPALHVNKEYAQEYNADKDRQTWSNQREREAFNYCRNKVEAAQMFIESIKQRKHTLYVTMKAIIALQKEFFLSQDDLKLKPMLLRDVAERTHLDESTISRVKNSKYALVDGQIYSLDHFFLRVRTNASGDAIMANEVRLMLQEIIDSEDKSAPYSDERLTELLRQKGLAIKHRTVTKYRNKMGIPTAKLRKRM